MGTSNRFYPKGTLGTEKAILWLACHKYPTRWREDAITKQEKSVWDGINKTFNGLVIDTELRLQVPKSDCLQMTERYCDFSEALNDLRKALQAGDIVAHFVDENGNSDFIKSYSWGGDGAEEVLLTGIALLDDGWTRLVLLNEADLKKVFGRKLGEQQSCGTPLPSPPSSRVLDEWYQERILSFQNRGKAPTIAEDEIAAKSAFPGVTRSMVRECRQKLAPAEWGKRGPRGKRVPKTILKSAANSAGNSAED